jgi:3-oxoacyl-[acyl-carrier-protein] synthase III
MKEQVGICALSAYVPPERMSLDELAASFGVNEVFLSKKTGYRKVARKAQEEETSDLAKMAAEPLFQTHPQLRERLGALIVVTQNPDGYGLPHTAAILHGKLQLPHSVAAFDIALGCSGWVYGLSVLKSFMEANEIGYGLLVTADPYSKVIDRTDKNTALLFGDAATATLLGTNNVRWRMGKFVFGTDGTRWADIRVGEDRKLKMNGIGVFTFSATKVRECVMAAVEANGLVAQDIDHVLLHQGSRYIVDTVGSRLGMAEKTPFFENDVGNTVSSTIPMMLCDPRFNTDRRIVACGFGVGLSWAATVLSSANQGV